jgi:hypothetical protein
VEDVEIQGHTIVVLGQWNPAIFSPAWLRLNKLIGEKEQEASKVQFVVEPAASFSTDWLAVNVTQAQLVLGTTMPSEYQRLRDTAVGILTVLGQTPVSALGVNLEAHWKPSDYEEWHRFGDELEPKKFWRESLVLPGLQSLTTRGVRPDLWSGYQDVTIEPSTRIPSSIYARVNDHFWLRRMESQPSSRAEFPEERFRQPPVEPSFENINRALSILSDEWSGSLERSESILRRLIALSRAS